MNVEPRLAGRVALVTGAASGIGRAASLRLSREGAIVVATDVDDGGAEAVAGEIRAAGGVATALALDVSRETDWTAAVGRIASDRGRLDVTVHAAGIARSGSVLTASIEAFREAMTVNAEGALLAIRHSASVMRGAGRGSIVVLGSLYGRKPMAGAAPYSASKAAVAMITRAAALEFRQTGSAVRVNCVLPGWVKTPIWRSHANWAELVRRSGSEEGAYRALAAGLPTRRLAEPDEIAGVVAFLASDDAIHVTGAEISVDGGLGCD